MSCVLLLEAPLASSAEANFWSERRAVTRRGASPASPVAAALPALESPGDVRVGNALSPLPAATGEPLVSLLKALSPADATVRKITPPSGLRSSAVVIHIQDVHRNAEAQRHIGACVQALQEARSPDGAPLLSLVALEGAFRPLALERYRQFPERAVVAQVADHLLRLNKISGPVHAFLTGRGRSAPLLGVDDAGLHDANKEAYLRSVAALPAVEAFLSVRRRELEEQKARCYSPALLRLDDAVSAHRDGSLGLPGYARAVAGPRPAGQVGLFLRALEMEEALDFSRVEAERTRALKRLMDRLPPADSARLLAAAVDVRAGRLRQAEFYRVLRDLIARHGGPADVPSLDAYIRYVMASDALDGEALGTELAAAEGSAYARLASTPEQRSLATASRRWVLTRRLTDFALTPGEWREYSSFPAEKSGPDLSPFEDFYRAAEARDRAMADKLLRALGAGGKAAVLVTGGFHAPGLGARLAAAGCTVVSVVPKIEKIESLDGPTYLSAFTQEKSLLETLFPGDRLFLADSPVPPGALMRAMVAVAIFVRAGAAKAREALRSLGGRDEELRGRRRPGGFEGVLSSFGGPAVSLGASYTPDDGFTSFSSSPLVAGDALALAAGAALSLFLPLVFLATARYALLRSSGGQATALSLAPSPTGLVLMGMPQIGLAYATSLFGFHWHFAFLAALVPFGTALWEAVDMRRKWRQIGALPSDGEMVLWLAESQKKVVFSVQEWREALLTYRGLDSVWEFSVDARASMDGPRSFFLTWRGKPRALKNLLDEIHRRREDRRDETAASVWNREISADEGAAEALRRVLKELASLPRRSRVLVHVGSEGLSQVLWEVRPRGLRRVLAGMDVPVRLVMDDDFVRDGDRNYEGVWILRALDGPDGLSDPARLQAWMDSVQTHIRDAHLPKRRFLWSAMMGFSLDEAPRPPRPRRSWRSLISGGLFGALVVMGFSPAARAAGLKEAGSSWGAGGDLPLEGLLIFVASVQGVVWLGLWILEWWRSREARVPAGPRLRLVRRDEASPMWKMEGLQRPGPQAGTLRLVPPQSPAPRGPGRSRLWRALRNVPLALRFFSPRKDLPSLFSALRVGWTRGEKWEVVRLAWGAFSFFFSRPDEARGLMTDFLAQDDQAPTYWERTSPPYSNTYTDVRFPGVEMKDEVDVLVVGDQLTGAAAAYEFGRIFRDNPGLRRRTDVLVVGDGRGSSTRNAGVAVTHIDVVTLKDTSFKLLLEEIMGPGRLTEAQALARLDVLHRVMRRNVAMMRETIEQEQEIIRREGIQVGFRQGGRLDLSERPVEQLQGDVREALDKGLVDDWDALAAGEVARRTGIRGRTAFINTDSAVIHPAEYVRLLMTAALEKGRGRPNGHDEAIQHFRATVTDLRWNRGRWEASMDTPRGPRTVRAQNVILASEVLTQKLFPNDPRVTANHPHRSQIHVFRADRPLAWDAALMTHGTIYLRQLDDHHLLVGSDDTPRPDLGPDRASPLVLYATFVKLRELFPEVGFTLEQSWAGTFGAMKDEVPVVGMLAPGLWAAYGFRGDGHAFGPPAGRFLAPCTLGLEDAEGLFPRKIFGPQRFSTVVPGRGVAVLREWLSRVPPSLSGAAIMTLVAALLAGQVYVADRFLSGASRFDMLYTRAMVIFAVLTPFMAPALARALRSPPAFSAAASPRRRAIAALLGLGVVAPTLADFFQFTGLPHTSGFITLILVNLQPVFVLGLARAAGRQKLTGRSIAGVSLALAGALAASLPGASAAGATSFVGAALVLGAAICWSVWIAFGGALSDRFGKVAVTWTGFGAAALSMYALSLGQARFLWTVPAVGFGFLELASILLYQAGIKRSGPVSAAVIETSSPLFLLVIAGVLTGAWPAMAWPVAAVGLIAAGAVLLSAPRSSTPGRTPREGGVSGRIRAAAREEMVFAGIPLLLGGGLMWFRAVFVLLHLVLDGGRGRGRPWTKRILEAAAPAALASTLPFLTDGSFAMFFLSHLLVLEGVARLNPFLAARGIDWRFHPATLHRPGEPGAEEKFEEPDQEDRAFLRDELARRGTPEKISQHSGVALEVVRRALGSDPYRITMDHLILLHRFIETTAPTAAPILTPPVSPRLNESVQPAPPLPVAAALSRAESFFAPAVSITEMPLVRPPAPVVDSAVVAPSRHEKASRTKAAQKAAVSAYMGKAPVSEKQEAALAAGAQGLLTREDRILLGAALRKTGLPSTEIERRAGVPLKIILLVMKSEDLMDGDAWERMRSALTKDHVHRLREIAGWEVPPAPILATAPAGPRKTPAALPATPAPKKLRALMPWIWVRNRNGDFPQGISLRDYPARYGRFAAYFLVKDLADKMGVAREAVTTVRTLANGVMGKSVYEPALLTSPVFFAALARIQADPSAYEGGEGMLRLSAELAADGHEGPPSVKSLTWTFASEEGRKALAGVSNVPVESAEARGGMPGAKRRKGGSGVPGGGMILSPILPLLGFVLMGVDQVWVDAMRAGGKIWMAVGMVILARRAWKTWGKKMPWKAPAAPRPVRGLGGRWETWREAGRYA